MVILSLIEAPADKVCLGLFSIIWKRGFCRKELSSWGVCVMLEGMVDVLTIRLAKAFWLSARWQDLVQFVGLVDAYTGYVISGMDVWNSDEAKWSWWEFTWDCKRLWDFMEAPRAFQGFLPSSWGCSYFLQTLRKLIVSWNIIVLV